MDGFREGKRRAVSIVKKLNKGYRKLVRKSRRNYQELLYKLDESRERIKELEQQAFQSPGEPQEPSHEPNANKEPCLSAQYEGLRHIRDILHDNVAYLAAKLDEIQIESSETADQLYTFKLLMLDAEHVIQMTIDEYVEQAEK